MTDENHTETHTFHKIWIADTRKDTVNFFNLMQIAGQAHPPQNLIIHKRNQKTLDFQIYVAHIRISSYSSGLQLPKW